MTSLRRLSMARPGAPGRGLAACGRVSVAAVSLLFAATPAGAQQPPPAEVPAQEVTPGWMFTPSVAFGISHDDNPLMAARGNPRLSDTVTVVRPGIDLTMLRKHTLFGAGYHGSYLRYNTLDQYNAYDQGTRVELRHQASKRVWLSATNTLAVTPTTEAVQIAGVPFVRTGTKNDNFVAGVTVAATKNFELEGTYRFVWLQFGRAFDPVVGGLLQGGRAHQVQLEGRRRVSERLRIGASWSIQHATVGRLVQSFDIQNTEGILDYQIAPTVSLEAGAGVSYIALPEPVGSHTGPAAHIGLRKRTEYAEFSIFAMRSFVPGFGIGGSLRNEQVVGSVRAPFSRRRGYVQGSLAWRDNQSVIQDTPPIEAVWAQGVVGYTLQRWLRIEGFYTGAWQDTPVAGGRVDRTTFGIQLVTAQPMRVQ